MSKQALIAFFIKDGASKLIDYVESSIHKKRTKKNSAPEENIDFQPSVLDFIILKRLTPNFDYCNKEILNCLKGKTREKALFKSGSEQSHKDIMSFRVLYKKYLNISKGITHDQKESSLFQAKINRMFGQKLFNKELEITEIADGLRQINKTINEIKIRNSSQSINLFKQIEKKLLIRRTQRLNYDYQSEQLLLAQNNYSNNLKQTSNIFGMLEDSEQYCGKIISETISRWFTTLLETIKLKDLLTNPKIIVEWENNLIQKEKQQIMAQQISGKMLFSIQQTINTIKSTIIPIDLSKQSQLRQKKVGVHSLSFENSNVRSQKHKNKDFKNVQQVSVIPYAEKNRLNKTNVAQQANESYQRMANRIKNLKNGQYRSNPTQNPMKQEPLNSNNQLSNNEKSKKCNRNTDQSRRFIYTNIKPSPLRPQNINTFKLKSKEKLQDSRLNPSINQSIKEINNSRISQPQQRKLSKIEIKFPIKLQNFQMQSWDSSFLCYKAETINLKELPLIFIKDRHKFGQNKVKIEYPCQPETDIIALVCKSMQILNCLGAEVYCEQEISYKSLNQIDSVEILSMSWLLQRSVKEIIKYYGQYFAGCPTKK